MSFFAKIFITSAFAFLILNKGFSQDINLDKIEMYYDQGIYKKVYKKSSKLLKTEKYKDSPTLILFSSLAEYQLSKTSNKFKETNAISNYTKFLQMDDIGLFRLKYDIYIYDIQLGLVNNIRALNNNGESDKAAIKYNEFTSLFGEGVSFEEITSNAPNIEDDELTSTTSTGTRENVVKFAKKLIGTPYKYGGNTKSGFDCSGFTQYVLAHNGYNIPRTAQSQRDNYKTINASQANKGDLVFFGSTKKNISHVGIIISEKGEELTMIHASSSKGIIISNIENDSYWTPKIQFFGQIITD